MEAHPLQSIEQALVIHAFICRRIAKKGDSTSAHAHGIFTACWWAWHTPSTMVALFLRTHPLVALPGSVGAFSLVVQLWASRGELIPLRELTPGLPACSCYRSLSWRLPDPHRAILLGGGNARPIG